MENQSNRTERVKKAKKIFSPSDPSQPSYYLVTNDGPEKFKIVGRTSILRMNGDVAVLKSGKTADVLTSGMNFYTTDDNNHDEMMLFE